MKNRIVIGGGAAGYFGAIAKKVASPSSKVILLEGSLKPLSKVRISGGGRCNVTHHCFDPHELVKNYPRGSKELLGPFSRFGPKDTWNWFESRGVPLKIERDGRIFPQSDSSESIIQALQNEANRVGVDVRLGVKVEGVKEGFVVQTRDGELLADEILLATGSSPIGHKIASSLGHTIIDPVPSLFTFNVPTSPLLELSGVSVPTVELTLGKLKRRGPLLITHWGFSGPAVLALSAFGARELASTGYAAELLINWMPEEERLPKRLQKALAERGVDLKRDRYLIEGKSTHKEEFVTAGGVKLSEVNFRTMESRIVKGLFFAGELLDIDAVTGGFNFQAAWTTSYLAGQA